jgi:hypothetical protein
MIFTTGFGLVALASQVLAREMAPEARTESMYRSGAFMQQMMAQKEVQLDTTIELSEVNQKLGDLFSTAGSWFIQLGPVSKDR